MTNYARAKQHDYFHVCHVLLEQLYGSAPSDPPAETGSQLLLRARAELRESLKQVPDQVNVLAALGKTYRNEQGELSEGIHALARAFELAPMRLDLLADLIVVTARSGNRAGARSLLDRVLRRRGDVELIRSVERDLLELDLREAQQKWAAGEREAAAQLAKDAAAQVRDPELRRSALENVASLEGSVRQAQLTDRFNEAVNLLNAGDVARSRESLAGLLRDGAEGELEDRVLDLMRRIDEWVDAQP